MRMISTRVSFRSIISRLTFVPRTAVGENKFTPGQHGGDEGDLLTFRSALPPVHSNQQGRVSPIRKLATHPNFQRLTSVLPVIPPEPRNLEILLSALFSK